MRQSWCLTRCGRRWWEIDPIWGLIRLLEVVRLAREVQRPRRGEAGRSPA